MSQFDREVLEWLNEASLPSKSVATVLNRVGAGVDVYQAMHSANSSTLNDVGLNIDFGLRTTVDRAQRRVADEVKPVVLLPAPQQVPLLAIRKPMLTTTRAPLPVSARGVTPRTGRSDKAPATGRSNKK